MRAYFKLVIIGFLVFCQGALFAEDKLSKKEVVEDIRYFFHAVETIHPDPYTAFGGKIEFKRLAQHLLVSIPEDGLTKMELYDHLNPFIAKLRDLHTSLSRPAQDESNTAVKYLPVRFQVATDGLFISSVKPEYQKLVGFRLWAIDQVPIEELLKRTMAKYRAENKHGGLGWLAALLRTDRGLARIINTGDVVEFTLENSSKKLTTISFPYMTKEDYNSIKSLSDEPAFEFDSNGLISSGYLDADKRVAYFRLFLMESRESFQIRQAMKHVSFEKDLRKFHRDYVGGNFPDDLDKAMQQLPSICESLGSLLTDMKKNGSTHLVFDIRDNGGGWSDLISPMLYLIYGDSYFEKNIETETIIRISEFYLRKFSKTIEEFNEGRDFKYDPGDYLFISKKSEGGAVEKRDAYLKDLRDDGLQFVEFLEPLNGRPICKTTVIVLANPRTGSAAFHLLYYLWQMGAKTIGVPPGQAGNAFMDVTRIQLPHSGIQGNVAHSAMILFPNDPKMGNTFSPQYPMTIEDYREVGCSTDAEILYTLKLIKDGILE